MTKMMTESSLPMRRELYNPTAGLTLRSNEDGTPSRVIEGYAIRFNEPSHVLGRTKDGTEWREIIAPEAVTRELLDGSDILMTLFHDRQQILARSKHGAGTLSYEVDATGVKFRFTAPHTTEGDKAVELVGRGELDGCSFAFSTRYGDAGHVSRETATDAAGKKTGLFTVRRMTGIYDFTITDCPAYPTTSVANRDLVSMLETESGDREKKQHQGGDTHRAPLHVRRGKAMARLDTTA